MKKPTRTPLSDDQLADAKRLSDIYKARAKESKLRGDQPSLTQTEVGEQCGWNSPQSTVSQYMNGKVALNLDALIKLARVLGFEPAEVSPTLAGGVRVLAPSYLGQLQLPEQELSDNVGRYTASPAPRLSPLPGDGDTDEDRYAHIPQLTAKAAAGLGHENPHVESTTTLAFKREWLKVKGLNAKNLVVIYADGDSMWPTICDHDVLLVDVSRVEPVDGQVFVLTANDGAIVKRLVKTAMGGWIIRSDNAEKEEYKDRVPLRAENNEHRIIGQVIWRGGDL
jgi:phage repressor protein C with HTH and peptisase S24 domain